MQQNFRVGLYSRGIIHHFVPCRKKYKRMMYFLAYLGYRDVERFGYTCKKLKLLS